MKNTEWYKLDNMGVYYASTKDRKNPTVFRFTATMKDDVDVVNLRVALEDTMEVYPNFNVTLKKGLFWYYLEEEHHLPDIKEENKAVCARVYKSEYDILYRVSYYKKRINFEVSHIVSDGRGTIEVFKTLIANYVKYQYKVKNIKLSNSTIEEHSEDSFDKYYEKYKKDRSKEGKIFRLKNKLLPFEDAKFIELHLNCKKVLDKAHEYNSTITAYLGAVLIQSILKEMKQLDKGKYIRVDLPVDLRSYFRSESSRNFFGLTYLSYKFNGEVDDIDKIIKVVNDEMTEKIKKENISKRVNKMVSFQKNFAVRAIPIFIKDMFLNTITEFVDNGTTSLSNVGKISFSKEVDEYVETVAAMISPEKNFKITICTYGNDLVICISDKFRRNNIVKNYVRSLIELDKDAFIISNGV